GELVPQRLQQANWQDRHGASTAEMACTCTVAGARAWLLLLFSHLPIVGRSKRGGSRRFGIRLLIWDATPAVVLPDLVRQAIDQVQAAKAAERAAFAASAETH